MQTVIRINPFTGATQAYFEYSPQEIDEAREKAQERRMFATGNFRSTHGAIDPSEFVPDTGTRTRRRIKTH